MNNTLQDHWKALELVGIDSIVFSDENIKLIDISYQENKDLVHTFGKEYHFNITGETDLNKIRESMMMIYGLCVR